MSADPPQQDRLPLLNNVCSVCVWGGGGGIGSLYEWETLYVRYSLFPFLSPPGMEGCREAKEPICKFVLVKRVESNNTSVLYSLIRLTPTPTHPHTHSHTHTHTHTQEYIACTQVWIEYVAKHFTVSQSIARTCTRGQCSK